MDEKSRDELYLGKVPSPSSTQGMNVRYLRITDETSGLRADVDIGSDIESMLETGYTMRFPNREAAENPVNKRGWEKLTRIALMEGMVIDLNTWPFALVLTVVAGDRRLTKAFEAHRTAIVDLSEKVVDSIRPQDSMSNLFK